ncbi:MAG: hypothetical protein QM741_18005 [Rudaea sp.]|uniref:hypothetical protein n=1 Tax=Rudaea sp. TaxID=2136325 RepID=UPI0039E67E30
MKSALTDQASRIALRRIGASRRPGWLAVVAMPVVSRVLVQADLVPDICIARIGSHEIEK